jgi:membrane protein YqaA with SNARE-associated domain
MVDIGQEVYHFFSALGPLGWLAAIFVLFYIDAIIFPTLPELITIIIFIAGLQTMSAWALGILILATIAVAEFAGLATLYLIVKKVKVPKTIRRVVCKYKDFLIVKDERIILVNRIAPVLPFLGAFVAILDWSFRKAVIYTLVGGVVKYGLILLLSSWFFEFLSEGTAELVTLIMVIGILVASFALSLVRRRRMKKDNANCPP